MIFHYTRDFFDFFIGFSVGLLLNDFLERRYSNEFIFFKEYMIKSFTNFSFNCIYYFGKLQIIAFQVKNDLNSFIEANPTLLKLRDDICNLLSKNNDKRVVVQFVKDGLLYDNVIENYDFMINTFLDKDILLKRLFYNNCEVNNIFEESNIKFMLVEFKIGENTYKIDFKRETFNYYLVNNKFTKDFFKFYIKNHLYVKDEINNNEKCSVKIIDHDVNKIELDFTDKNEYIILEKYGYKLNITNHPDNK